jgi:hypothetical protein
MRLPLIADSPHTRCVLGSFAPVEDGVLEPMLGQPVAGIGGTNV